MSRLAQTNQVLFVESLGLRRPQLAGRDLKRIWRRLVRGLGPAREADGLHVLAPLVLPFHSVRLVREINARLLPLLVGRAVRRLGMSRPVLWAYVPQAEALTPSLDPELVIYHCVDDIAEQKGVDAASFRAAEHRFASRADLVLASAPALAERMRTLSENVLFAPNVADTEHFATALREGPVDAPVAALPEPRIVFTGAVVATKLDVGLLLELARLRPDWSFVIVGPIGLGDPGTDVGELGRRPNVHLVGGRPYSELPAVLRSAQAAIIPYHLNELTRSIFPMKVFEYLGAGVPVVSTPLPSLAGVEHVVVADSPAEMAEALDEVLRTDSPEAREARSAAVQARSWDTRLREIDAALAS